MSNRPKGRHPRHVRAIADRYPNREGGVAITLDTAPPEWRRRYDWFPGNINEAVARARIAYPGCAIRRVEEMEWLWYITLLEA
jgi:hypothetical protein